MFSRIIVQRLMEAAEEEAEEAELNVSDLLIWLMRIYMANNHFCFRLLDFDYYAFSARAARDEPITLTLVGNTQSTSPATSSSLTSSNSSSSSLSSVQAALPIGNSSRLSTAIETNAVEQELQRWAEQMRVQKEEEEVEKKGEEKEEEASIECRPSDNIQSVTRLYLNEIAICASLKELKRASTTLNGRSIFYALHFGPALRRCINKAIEGGVVDVDLDQCPIIQQAERPFVVAKDVEGWLTDGWESARHTFFDWADEALYSAYKVAEQLGLTPVLRGCCQYCFEARYDYDATFEKRQMLLDSLTSRMRMRAADAKAVESNKNAKTLKGDEMKVEWR